MITSLTIFSFILVPSSAQILNLKSGKVHGFTHETKEGNFAEVFLNIPYASPPVGELRFEKPRPPEPWKEIRDGTKFGASCHPIVPQATFKEEQPNEDCLTLNIIRPKKETPAPGFPILFWVHGGGYEVGSARSQGYEGFADIYTPHGIIVVTIQYRLGVYGFFSTGDSRIPGNLGLFDMAEALKFIYTNAANIGGDPKRITVWGHSAGSAAAGQLILSPVTRDYIIRSIEMSGSPWSTLGLGVGVANNSLELAEVLGCRTNVKECMKRKTVEEIYKGIQQVHPDQMTATATPRAAIVGVTNKEAAFFSIMKASPIQKFYVDPADYNNWNRGRLISELKKFVQKAYVGNHLEELLKEIVTYYVDRDEEKHYEFYIDRYTQEKTPTEAIWQNTCWCNGPVECLTALFLSDLLFVVPSEEGIVARRSAGWDMYAYSLDHYNEEIWSKEVPKRLRGAPHGSVSPYTKGASPLKQFNISEEERVIADVFRQSFAQFAKTGALSNNHVTWLNVGTDTDLRYLQVGLNPQMKQGFYNESTSFWHKMLKYGFDMVQLRPVQESGRGVKQKN